MADLSWSLIPLRFDFDFSVLGLSWLLSHTVWSGVGGRWLSTNSDRRGRTSVCFGPLEPEHGLEDCTPDVTLASPALRSICSLETIHTPEALGTRLWGRCSAPCPYSSHHRAQACLGPWQQAQLFPGPSPVLSGSAQQLVCDRGLGCYQMLECERQRILFCFRYSHVPKERVPQDSNICNWLNVTSLLCGVGLTYFSVLICIKSVALIKMTI